MGRSCAGASSFRKDPFPERFLNFSFPMIVSPLMSYYQKHLFVCTNQRPEGDPRGSCAEKGAESLRAFLKVEMKKRGLHKTMRPNSAGCLDACEHGPVMVIYPEGVWYQVETEGDMVEVIEQHLMAGVPVERLIITARAQPKGSRPPPSTSDSP